MFINSNPIIKVTSDSYRQNIHSIVPNFMFVNQPEVKALETKVKKHKKLVVWFDMRNENDHHFDQNNIYPNIELDKFKFQLLLQTSKGFKLVKPLQNKEVSEFDKLVIKKDFEGNIIDSDNSLIYELDEEKLDNDKDLTFKYILSYQNKQNLGLTSYKNIGNNQGLISIDNKNNNFVFNNAFAYLENAKNKVVVLNRDRLEIKKRAIKQLDELNSPILEVSANNETYLTPELAKSEQIRGELARITNNGINYLQSSEKTLKTVKKNNNYQVYLNTGNHYDFQSNKWVNSQDDKTIYHPDKKLNLIFEYNYQKFEVELEINDPKLVIKTIKNSDKELTKVSSYQNVKPNTKFDTFVTSRKSY